MISDSTNLVPDEQLQTAAVWNPTGAAEWHADPDRDVRDALSIGEVRWNNPGATTGSAVLDRRPVLPGAGRATCSPASFRMRNFAATASTSPTRSCQFLDVDGASISTPALFNPARRSPRQQRRRAGRDGHGAGRRGHGALALGGRPGADHGADVCFFAPSVRRQTQTVEIADGAITAAKANFTDLGAVVATLGTCTITSSLNFADGVVVTGASPTQRGQPHRRRRRRATTMPRRLRR